MTTIKVTFGHEIRRVTLANQEARGLSSYADFVRTITTLFPQLSDTTVSLIWYDDDGDKITVSSDLEFQEAVRFMDQQPVDGKKVLRFEVLPVAAGVEATPAVAAPSVEVVIHRGITCDECGMSPIHGIRYKCTVRDDYDLCEGCEAKKIQPYPMIKICDPTQSPSAILFAFNDDRAPGSWRRHGFRGPHGHHHGPPGFGPHGHGPHGHGPHGHGPHGHGPHGHGPHGHGPHGPGPHGPGPHGPGPHGHGPHGHGPHGHSPHGPGPHGPGPHGPGPHGPGPHGPGPHGPGPHGCPRRGGGPHPFAGLFGIPDHKGRESCGGWERRAEKCGRRFGEVVAPFVEAMDKIFADADPVPTEASVAADKVPEDTLEEQLMQEAIQESILLNEVAEAFASVSLPNSESSATAAAAPTTTYASSVQQLPKPALRFVRDLTFPDGTAVQPGASFQKSWRVRNDGKHAWPQDCVLATAGGDLLCPEDLKVALATTAAGEETEITVDLRAPNAPGLYTAYFRAQTKEQQSFGHRLWATILVTEPEDGWMPVSKSDSVSPAISPSASSVTITAAEAAPVVTEVAAAAPVEAPAPVPVAESETPSALPAVVKPLHLLWRRELQVLADMGFVDYDANLPLLQEHLVSPVSLAGDRNAAPSIEGMQRVVGAILANLNA